MREWSSTGWQISAGCVPRMNGGMSRWWERTTCYSLMRRINSLMNSFNYFYQSKPNSSVPFYMSYFGSLQHTKRVWSVLISALSIIIWTGAAANNASISLSCYRWKKTVLMKAITKCLMGVQIFLSHMLIQIWTCSKNLQDKSSFKIVQSCCGCLQPISNSS